jgi:hypothetical protein
MLPSQCKLEVVYMRFIHQDHFVGLIIHVKFLNGKLCDFFLIVFKTSFC